MCVSLTNCCTVGKESNYEDARVSILLRQLRLPTVAANYAKFAKEAAADGQSHEEYLLALLNHEVNQREINRRKRRIREARFPILCTLDEFDFSAIPSLNKTKVLQLADGEYIQRHENLALIGSIGTGKTQPRKCMSRNYSFYWRVRNHHRSAASAVWTNLAFSSHN